MTLLSHLVGLSRAGLGTVLMASLVTGHAAEADCPESAQAFWKGFRAAVLRGDARRVADVSEFPFTVKGTLDDSPTRSLQRPAFIQSYRRLADADPGLTPEPSTMKSLVRQTRNLSPGACTNQGNTFRVGGWQFEAKPAGWRFVLAVVDDQ